MNDSLDEKILDEIKKDYLSQMEIKDILEKYNIKYATLREICKDLPNRNGKKEKLSKEEKERLFFKYYNEKISLEKLGEEFKISRATIDRYIKNGELERRKPVKKRQHNFNLKKFQIDSKEKFYWLGFIAADGAVVKNTLSIELKKIDEEHLKNFNSFFENENQLKYRTNNQNVECVKATINSAELIEYLKKYNIVQNKSKTFEIPENIPDYYLMDFARGLIDGDGCIRINNQNQISLSFCSGNKNCCEQLEKILHINNKISYSGNCWRFQVTGNIKAKNILDNLYKKSNEKIRLKRKYNIYRSLSK